MRCSIQQEEEKMRNRRRRINELVWKPSVQLFSFRLSVETFPNLTRVSPDNTCTGSFYLQHSIHCYGVSQAADYPPVPVAVSLGLNTNPLLCLFYRVDAVSRRCTGL